MDIIEIKNLEIFANHGVFPEENVLGQKFVVSAKLYTSTRKAAAGIPLMLPLAPTSEIRRNISMMAFRVLRTLRTAKSKLYQNILSQSHMEM